MQRCYYYIGDAFYISPRKYSPQRGPVTGGNAAKDNKMILFIVHRFTKLQMLNSMRSWLLPSVLLHGECAVCVSTYLILWLRVSCISCLLFIIYILLKFVCLSNTLPVYLYLIERVAVFLLCKICTLFRCCLLFVQSVSVLFSRLF